MSKVAYQQQHTGFTGNRRSLHSEVADIFRHSHNSIERTEKNLKAAVPRVPFKDYNNLPNRHRDLIKKPLPPIPGQKSTSIEVSHELDQMEEVIECSPAVPRHSPQTRVTVKQGSTDRKRAREASPPPLPPKDFLVVQKVGAIYARAALISVGVSEAKRMRITITRTGESHKREIKGTFSAPECIDLSYSPPQQRVRLSVTVTPQLPRHVTTGRNNRNK